MNYNPGARLLPAPITGLSGAALGFLAAVVSVLLGALGGDMFGWQARAPISFALLVLAALSVGVTTTVAGALAASAQGWAVYSGFVLNRLGELRLAPADRSALLVMVGLAVLASLVAAGVRQADARRHRYLMSLSPRWVPVFVLRGPERSYPIRSEQV
jgi:hypothetical protein